jgi:UDP-glucose 6-dehydrogenase
MKVSVIGTGYVGLVSGVCLAATGHEVICVDTDEAKIARINAGDPPIYEAGLEDLLKRHVGRSLHATKDMAAAVLGSDISLIAVGTPFDGATIDLAIRPPGRARYRLGIAGKVGLSRRRRQEHRGSRDDRGRGAAAA